VDFSHGVMVTITSVTTTDDGLGNTSETTTETSWGPCAIAPRYATESTDPRVPPVIVGKTVYGPRVALDSDDRLVIDGVTYQVDGLPGEWRNPFTGWDAGIEVPVKRASAV
jgi:hypothetical protein